MIKRKLQQIIDEYKMSGIQSEAEVRSKFLVPLIEYLGYASFLRAEEFPVYGWQGGKRNQTKKVDFILFSDGDFTSYRNSSALSISWVQDHSLLICEAKKPGEMPEFNGQAIYYTQWTKAIAYLVSDGETLRGFYYSPICYDYELVNCKVNDLKDEDLSPFLFRTIFPIKCNSLNQHKDFFGLGNGLTIYPGQSISVIADEKGMIPEEVEIAAAKVIGMERKSGVPQSQIIKKTIKTVDNIVDSDLRYNIPEFAFFLVRNSSTAKLYIDNSEYPVMFGVVEQYYWNDIDKYRFSNEYFELEAVFENKILCAIKEEYYVLCKKAKERLLNLKAVRRCLDATVITIVGEDDRLVRIPDMYNFLNDEDFIQLKEITDYFIEGIAQMIEIERAFNIKFDLEDIDSKMECSDLYDLVELVYNGICGECNCQIPFLRSVFLEIFPEQEIEEPFFLDMDQIPLPEISIGMYCFIPKKVMVLPEIYREQDPGKDHFYIKASCSFVIDKNIGGHRPH